MLRKQILNYLKLRFSTLIISMFYKFRTYFQNVVTVLEVKVLDIRNWLTFIHNLYKWNKCIFCKVVTILALNIIIESLVLYFRILAVLRSYSFALSVRTLGFITRVAQKVMPHIFFFSFHNRDSNVKIER